MSGSFARVKRVVAVVPLAGSKFRLTCARKNHSETWFINNGCAVTAGIMAAVYRDNTTYGIHSFDMSIRLTMNGSPFGQRRMDTLGTPLADGNS